MPRMFAGPAIPGLMQASIRLINGEVRRTGHPIEFDDLLALVAAKGFDDPRTADHLEWMVVNDPRVQRRGKIIRRYTGPVDD